MANPIATYLLTLRHEAHRVFPADHAEEVVAEVETHLEERISAQVRDGTPRSLSEADALRDFGAPRKLISGLLHASYETPLASRARVIALTLVSLSLALVTIGATSGYSGFSWWPILCLLLGGSALILGSLLGRRPMPGAYGAIAVAWVLGMSLYQGFAWVDTDSFAGSLPAHIYREPSLTRSRAGAMLENWDSMVRRHQQEVGLLQLGWNHWVESQRWVKDQHTALALTPAELMVHGEFIIPRAWSEESRLHGTAFKNVSLSDQVPDNVSDQEKAWRQEYHLQPFLTTASFTTASQAWASRAPGWLKETQNNLEELKWRRQIYEGIAAAPITLNDRVALETFGQIWVLVPVLLALDLAAAAVGRFFWRVRREWAWRIRTARV